MPLTQERLRELFSYDKETGLFTRLVSVSSNAKAGDIAGWANNDGYLSIRVEGRMYRSHRLAWLYEHGEWPQGEIDHINGDRSDNRIANLRHATRSENQQNVASYRDSSSKFLGVSWKAGMRKWRAAITIKGVKTHLGYFADENEAAAAYIAAKKSIHEFQPSVRSASNDNVQV